MVRVAVVYHSGTGNTKRMAEAIYAGASSSADVHAQLYPIIGEDIRDGRWKNEALLEELDSCQAILFGSPTYMGSMSGQFKAFLDAAGSRYLTRKWANKIAGGYTLSGELSGDKLNTLVGFTLFAAQMGMIWVGADAWPEHPDGLNAVGGYLGAMATAFDQPVSESDLRTATMYGARVAAVALQWSAAKAGSNLK